MLLAVAVASALAWQWWRPQDPAGWFALAAMAVFGWFQYRQHRRTERSLQRVLAEREGLAGELRSQRDQALRLQRQRPQILSGVAHNLRQSLWALRLYTEMLTRSGQNPQSMDLLQRQLSAIDDANATLDQFSRLAAIERGQLVVNAAPVELRALLACVAGDQQDRLPDPMPEVRLHGRHTVVRTDPAHLASVLHALVRQAMEQAAAARGEEARVVLAVRRHGGGCAVDVLDNGAGIAPERLGQVFEPFAPLDTTGSTGRQGLALTLAHSLAAALGMKIEVRSTLQHGTRFRLVVPRHLVQEETLPVHDYCPV